MAIYARFGTPVDFVSARFFPVWIEQRPGAIKWHYREPKKIGKKASVKVTPIMHVQAIDLADHNDPLYDGKWVDTNSFRADDGMKEITARVMELYPDAQADYDKWNKADGPEAHALFPPVDSPEIIA